MRTKTTTVSIPTLVACAFLASVAAQAQSNSCPLHAQHMAAAGHAEASALDRRGDEVMGFAHTRTTHHFRATPEGGAIQVEVRDPADAESLASIRAHLTEVATAFAAGDFAMPRQIHDRVLPGTDDMIRLKDAISYRYVETEGGAEVRVVTADPGALAAIHAFFGAQIEDHRTGDPPPGR